MVAPETSSLLGLVSRLAPPLVSGNTVVLLASETRPLPAITLSEVLATSDVPGGVVNILTGHKKELVPVLAGHVDVDALDVWGVPDDMRVETEQLAADDIKRVSRRPATRQRCAVRLARRPGLGAPRVDRRLPRDEDGLAPDRGLSAMAVRPDPEVGYRRAGDHLRDDRLVERRVFVQATPRAVWAALHDPTASSTLFPELRLGPAAPSWPAAAATRTARTRLGLLREMARVESLEARPESVFRLRVTGSGFESEWSWRLQPIAGGTRVIHGATFELDRPLDEHPRASRSAVARGSCRGPPAGAQGTSRARGALPGRGRPPKRSIAAQFGTFSID